MIQVFCELCITGFNKHDDISVSEFSVYVPKMLMVIAVILTIIVCTLEALLPGSIWSGPVSLL